MGKFGGEKEGFFNPTSIAISPTGQVYVVDIHLHRIQKFASVAEKHLILKVLSQDQQSVNAGEAIDVVFV